MRKYLFLLFSFLSNVGDAIFLTGVPLYLYSQTGSLLSASFVPLVISISILVFRNPILKLSSSNPVLITAFGELSMVGIEILILLLLPFVEHTVLLSVATIPLAMAYNTYGSAKFFRIQESFFDDNVIFWTSLQSSLNRIGFILGGSGSALVLAKWGIQGLIWIDLFSFLAFGLFMLSSYKRSLKAAVPRNPGIDQPKPQESIALPKHLTGAIGLMIMSAITFFFVWERSSLIPSASMDLQTGADLIGQYRAVVIVLTVIIAAVMIRVRSRLVPSLFQLGVVTTLAGGAMVYWALPEAGLITLLVGVGLLMVTQLPLQKLIYSTMGLNEEKKGRLIAAHWVGTAALTPFLLPIGYIATAVESHALVVSLALIAVFGVVGGYGIISILLARSRLTLIPAVLVLIATVLLGSFYSARGEKTRPFSTALLGNLPKSLDPADLSEVNYSTLFNQVCGRLTSISSGLNIEGDLARSWDISANKLRYTFVLRDDRKFFDGTPVTSDDIIYSLKRAFSNQSSVNRIAMDVRSAGVHKLEINLRAPNPRLLYDLSDPRYCVLSQRTPFLSVDGAKVPNSTGVYRISSLGSDWVALTKWSTPNGYEVGENEVRVHFVPQAKAVELFQKGELDDLSFYFLTDDEAQTIDANSKKIESQIFWSWTLSINPKSPLFKELAERKSLVQFLARQQSEFLNIWDTSIIPGQSIIPKGMRGHSAFDVANLRISQPAVANESPGSTCRGRTLRLSAIDGLPDQENLKRALQSQLSQWAPNCQIELDFLPMDLWFKSYAEATHDLYFAGLDPSSLDPLSYFRYFIAGTHDNTLGYDSVDLNRQFAELYQTAESERDPEMVLNLNRTFYENGFGLVYGYPKFDFYFAKHVTSAHVNPLGMHLNRWWEMRRKK